MTGSPRLILRCGKCNTADLGKAVTGAQPLPGENFSVIRAPKARYDAYPRKENLNTFVHVFNCPRCRARIKVTGERLGSWWDDLTTSGQAESVRYPGRDL